jgi:hypothetical protein
MKKIQLVLIGGILTASLFTNAQTLNIRAASSVDGKIDCNWARDRMLTTISGPCENFLPPKQISLGESFSANGKNLRINVMRATKYTADSAKLTGANPALWYCVAADSEKELPQADSRGLKGTWLYIKNCQPIN